MNKLMQLAVIGLGLASTTSFAGLKQNSVGLTFAGGSLYLDKTRRINNPSITLVGINYQFTSSWGIEAMVGMFRTRYRPILNYPKQVNGQFYQVDGVYHFTPEKSFSPYVLAGVGVNNLYSPTNQANAQAAINAGLGIQYFANEIVSLRAEARDLYTFVGGNNDIYIAAGINFALTWC